jgi:hypothetical protein
MNIDTGEIKRFFDESELKDAIQKGENLVEIDENDMTEKQKLNKKVSLHDNKSKLGKKRIREKRKQEAFGLEKTKGAFGKCKNKPILDNNHKKR